MNEKHNRPRPMGLNIGSASIIMLFAVLCLTVLAALSLLSANSQYALAERSAEVSRAYYDAETRAAEIYELVKSGDLSSVDAIDHEGETFYSYTVEIDRFQAFYVVIAIENGEARIRSWKIVEAGDWTPDDFLDLWSGEESENTFDGSASFFTD